MEIWRHMWSSVCSQSCCLRRKSVKQNSQTISRGTQKSKLNTPTCMLSWSVCKQPKRSMPFAPFSMHEQQKLKVTGEKEFSISTATVTTLPTLVSWLPATEGCGISEWPGKCFSAAPLFCACIQHAYHLFLQLVRTCYWNFANMIKT